MKIILIFFREVADEVIFRQAAAHGDGHYKPKKVRSH